MFATSAGLICNPRYTSAFGECPWVCNRSRRSMVDPALIIKKAITMPPGVP